MALPAGRYGVTKNQLLKIKKLPMNTIKLIEDLYEKYSLLGSAAFKNSTSVVTESIDLVESGAVYDALGFGNKNKLPIFSSLVTTTINGITFTVTRDNNGNVTEIDANGTATADATLTLINTNPYGKFLKNGQNYILSGCPSGGSDNKYRLQYFYNDGSGHFEADFGDGLEFTCNNNYDRYNFAIFIKDGYTANHLKFYPMIRKATITDATFEPNHTSVEESKANKTDVYGLSYANMVEIPANSDLNNYKTAGSFISKISSTTNSLSNCPVTGSGINLHVESTAGGTGQYIIQTVKRSYDNTPEIWKRSYNGTLWGNWFKEVADESLKADNSTIAPTENGTTVQKSGGYAAGSHAIRNGSFITWKNAKAQGETINDASDYTSGDVADILAVNNYAVTAESPFSVSANTQLIKIGNMVILSLRIDNVSCSANTTTLIGSIPSAVKPKLSLNGVFVTFNNATGRLLVSDLGEIKINSSVALTSESVLANLIWII